MTVAVNFEKNFVKSWEEWDFNESSQIFCSVKLTDRLQQICTCMGMPETGIIDVEFNLEELELHITVYEGPEDSEPCWKQTFPVQLNVVI